MPADGFELRFGRQEIAFENHRLIGTVGWIEQARSFDALRAMFKHGMLSIDSFYAKVAEDASATKNDDGTPFHADDVDLLAGNIHLSPAKEFGIGAVVIGDFGSVRRVTAGGIVGGAADFGLAYSGEGYYQRGKTYGGVDHKAFMVGGALGYTAHVTTKPFLKGFAEYLSGDKDPDDNVERTFSTLYHTGHKFYGEMDFFLNLPVHTQKRGLLDAGGALGLSPAKGFGMQATFHHFRATAERPDGLDTFGNELDAELTYSPWSLLKLDFNYCFFAPGDIFTSGAADTKLEHFVYSTGDFAF
jgi:hypothetical protein